QAGGVQRHDDAGAWRKDAEGHLHQPRTDVRLVQRWAVPPTPHASQTRAARARLFRRQGASQDGWGGPLCQQEAQHGPSHSPTHRRVHGPKSLLDPGIRAVVSYVRGSHHWFLLHHWGVLVRISVLTASGFVIFSKVTTPQGGPPPVGGQPWCAARRMPGWVPAAGRRTQNGWCGGGPQ